MNGRYGLGQSVMTTQPLPPEMKSDWIAATAQQRWGVTGVIIDVYVDDDRGLCYKVRHDATPGVPFDAWYDPSELMPLAEFQEVR